MVRFYLPGTVAREVVLEGSQAHHALRVQRLQRGERVVVFNGEGGEYEGTVASCARNRVTIEIAEFHAIERESPLQVTLAQGISAGDNMDFTIQKAVELGVYRIQPLDTARSVVRLSGERAKRRVEHWQRVSISACEQCGRNRIPAVEPITHFGDWLNSLDASGVKLLLSPQAAAPLISLRRPDGPILLLAGPEGGLSPDEEQAALAAGLRAVALGPRVLRTETAAVAALSAMQALWGDF
jgi:16S rRNA (uracil1498-N3)-methyltransferase